MKKSNRPAVTLTQSEQEIRDQQLLYRTAETCGWNAWMKSEGNNALEILRAKIKNFEGYDSPTQSELIRRFNARYTEAGNLYGDSRKMVEGIHSLPTGEQKFDVERIKKGRMPKGRKPKSDKPQTVSEDGVEVPKKKGGRRPRLDEFGNKIVKGPYVPTGRPRGRQPKLDEFGNRVHKPYVPTGKPRGRRKKIIEENNK